MPQQQISPEGFKADYARYVSRATMLIHSKETSAATLSMLRQGDPVKAVSKTTVTLMQRLDYAARQAGVETSDIAKVLGAHEIVAQLAQLAKAAGIFELSEEYQHLALSAAVQDYIKGEIAAKRINPYRLNAVMQAEMRKMPPKQRKEVQDGMSKVEQTAKQYAASQRR